MPYITKERRAALAQGLDKMQKSGELNYQFTLLLLDEKATVTRTVQRASALITEYVEANNLNYQTINDVLGAVLGSLMEYTSRKGQAAPMEGALMQVMRDFYKEVAVPYETIKREQNGDVYVNTK